MKKKYIALMAAPMMALTLGVGAVASAHGYMGINGTPEEIAQREQNRFTQEAELLGVTVDEIKNGWAAGKTLSEIAEEKGITKDQLQEKMKTMHEQRLTESLKALVDKGVITQAQADQRLQVMKQHLEKGPGEMMRGGHGRGLKF